jgi:hypothetical protein
MLLSARGRFDEAVEQISKAADLDPLSLIIAVHAGWPFYFARDYESAIRASARRSSSTKTSSPPRLAGHGPRAAAPLREALDAFARALEVDRIPILTTMLAHTHAIAGDRDESLGSLGDPA